MEETKLWKVSGPKESLIVSEVPNVNQTETEELLEEILVRLPNLLLGGLKIIGRQAETAGGPLDLLGVGEDGELIVFELKRGTLTRDAIAQIIDYASYLKELSALELNKLVNDNSGKNGVEKLDNDFADWYEVQFGKPLATIGEPKMVLVGLGVDDRARRMVEFLAEVGVEISLMTFHGFTNGGETYLARQIEVAQREGGQSTKNSKSTNLQALNQKLKTMGIEGFFNKAATTVRTELHTPYEWPNRSGYTYYLQDITEAGTPSNHAYVSLSVPDAPKGSLILTLQDRATHVAGEEWPRISKTWSGRLVKRKGYLEVKISSEEDWKVLEPDVRALCNAIVQGRQAMQEQQVVAERQAILHDAGKEDAPL